jgi:hypothetical protein
MVADTPHLLSTPSAAVNGRWRRILRPENYETRQLSFMPLKIW